MDSDERCQTEEPQIGERNSTQGDPALEEHKQQGDYTLLQHSEPRDPTLDLQSEQEGFTVEEQSKQESLALINDTGSTDFEDTVAIDQSLLACYDNPKASRCEYEDRNPFSLLLLDQSSTLSALADAPGTAPSDPPSLNIDERVEHGERSPEEYNELDLIRGDGYKESDSTVAIDHCHSVS
ncbi:hypothetical protein BGZ67_003754 [Mortierella alpina]|nr:hypothetical protein BGZ67_003754 [Mortierella alpina]